MITITLPPELERVVSERAEQKGTTAEIYVLDELRLRFLPHAATSPPTTVPQTTEDYWKDYIGCIDSSDVFPEGSNLSEDTGRKFAALLVEKHLNGKL